jgi:hypothetical protein
MEKSKTYSLKNVLIAALAVSLGFVGISYLVSLTLGRFQAILLPDTGATWYYWKLPQTELWATVTMWVGYLAHQISVWWLISRLKQQPSLTKGRIGKVNLQLFVVNAVFIVLHIVQTTLFYDGLAQFVPVMSSQGSVIVMLVMILILLNFRRGLFFGHKAKLPKQGTKMIANIHGYFIAWAVIYTFWFHPIEGTAGHLLGFFYAFMLLTQLSLARTAWHTNIKWITVLEVYVAFHGAVVAINAGNGMWPMFFFGFMMMFIVTQAFGIIKRKAALICILAAYATLVLVTYSGMLGNAFSGISVSWGDIHQITWIPVILYGLAFLFVWLAQGASLLKRGNSRKKVSENTNP